MSRAKSPALVALGLVALLLVGSLLPGAASGRPILSGGTSATGGPLAGSSGLPTHVSPAGTPPLKTPAAPPPPSGAAASTVSAIERAGIPLRYAFLPNLAGRDTPPSRNGLVSLSYPEAPAPIGVADFGIVNRSGTLTAEDVTTSSLEGIFAPTAFAGLSADSGAPDSYGIQLNAVLTNVTLFGNASYSFWTQNVVEYSTFSHQLFFLDNVWNFSSSAAQLSRNVFYSVGPNGTQVGTTFYYALGPVITMGYPFTLTLSLASSLTGARDAVQFSYHLTNATRAISGTYDTVVFNSSGPGSATSPGVYAADGSGANRLGLPNDFEFVIGGPGGGSNFDAFNASAAIDLYYWVPSAASYRVVPSAYVVGGDTGETAAGLADTWLLGADATLLGTAGPAAHIGQGPAWVGGAWNVSNSTSGVSTFRLQLVPADGFTFIAAGVSPPFSRFQWAPRAASYALPPGGYFAWFLAADSQPGVMGFTLSNGLTTWANISLPAQPADGVYTPLWALAPSDLPAISSSCVASACVLLDNEPGPLGQVGAGPGAMTFPWFGTFNDFLFPEFPGILLWNVSNVVLTSPPPLTVATPPWLNQTLVRFGTPTTNDLEMLFYDDVNVTLEGAAAIGGWWFSGSYLGASVPQYSVVFWNTSSSTVLGNTFTTGGGGLYFYGGENNLVLNNTFLEYLPFAANSNSVSGATAGTNGLFDADFGDGRTGSAGCRCGDLIANNVFGTYHTAYSPTLDPYTGVSPRLPFEEVWNYTPRAGTNIVGSSPLGGNFWWDYGQSSNPFWVRPYNASGAIRVGGDHHPLYPSALVTLTFTEQGLPAGTAWEVGFYTSTGIASNRSSGTTITELWPAGFYIEAGGSVDGAYGTGQARVVTVGSTNLSVSVPLYRLASVVFQTSDLPNNGFWTVTLSNTTFGAYITLGNVPRFPAERVPVGTYSFSVGPPGGYVASPPAGVLDVTANVTVTVTFTSASTQPGILAGSVLPSSGVSLSVDGASVPISANGAYNDSLAPGIHSVEATAGGYAPYFNNVSVGGGATTTLAIVLTPLASGTTKATTQISLWAWVAIGGLAAAVIVLAIVSLVLYRRRPPSGSGPRVPYAYGGNEPGSARPPIS